ncbi:MAG: adenosylcobinamide-phosphate synthase CbiB [Thermoanaerobacteraceae bacterium]|nr:adenosylcobinamide-phosphate synthase CbiB [Thermoanaerobacteraceae bacterium]
MEVIAAYILDVIIGDPQGYPHPVRIIGKLITFLYNRLQKFAVDSKKEKIAGFFLCGFTVCISFFTVLLALYTAGLINPILRIVLSIILIYTCFATKDLQRAGLEVYKELKTGNLDNARKKLSFIVSRNTENLDVEGVSRGAVETVAESISDGIIAPMFYAFIGGAPLVIAYKAASTLDSMVGYKEEKYANIGYASAKLDDILNFIPARITGILIVIAAFLTGYDFKESFRILMRDRLKHESPNSAHGEAAVAGALNIKLGGLNYYFGKPKIKPTIGDGKYNITPEHIMGSLKLMYVSSILGLVVFFIVKQMIFRGGLLR